MTSRYDSWLRWPARGHRAALGAVAAVAVLGLGLAGPVQHGSAGSARQAAGSATAGPPSVVASTLAGRSLTALLTRGAKGVTSAHISMVITSGGITITSTGAYRMSDGRVTAMELTENVPGTGAVGMMIVNGAMYIHEATLVQLTKKQWLKVSAQSSSPQMRSIAQQLKSALAGSSDNTPNSYAALGTAAISVTKDGRHVVGGEVTTEYSLVVSPSKLPASNAAAQAAKKVRLSSIPVKIWVNGQGRPVRVSEQISVRGVLASVNVDISGYNAPVHIAAPPASEVTTNF